MTSRVETGILILAKALKRPERYFRECCVINAYRNKFKRAYYTHSVQLFYANKWLKSLLPPDKPFQRELYEDFHNQKYFSAEQLKAAQERRSKSDYLIQKALKPKLPDVWLVEDYPKSIFIEAKGFNEDYGEGQKEGFAVIKKYLGCDVRIARVCSQNELLQGINFNDVDITEIYQKV